MLWLIPPEEATEDNLSSTDVSLASTPIASPRSSLEEVRSIMFLFRGLGTFAMAKSRLMWVTWHWCILR